MALFDSIKKKISDGMPRKHKHISKRDPYRDWEWLLMSAVIIAICSIVIDGYIFFNISTGSIFTLPKQEPSTMATFNRQKLKSTNDYYDAQEKHLFDLKLEKPQTIDPSL